MSSGRFEAQAAIFSALTSSSEFMSAAGSLYDTPPDNKTYPYVCLEAINTTPSNRHGYKGWRILFTFGVYTKPGSLGTYPTELIETKMDDVLNLKKFELVDDLKMVICEFVTANYFRNGDIQGANITYGVTVHDDAYIF